MLLNYENISKIIAILNNSVCVAIHDHIVITYIMCDYVIVLFCSAHINCGTM